MNSLSCESLNGLGCKIPIQKMEGFSVFEEELQLTPDWELLENVAPWWIQPRLRPGQITTVRRTPEKGEIYKSEQGALPAKAFTPSSDERNLPSAWTGEPLKQYPKRDFPGSFPHTWIPYEDVKPVVGPEMGPTPPGWAPIPLMSEEEERSYAAATPQPWSSPENMAVDVSGFGSLHEAISAPRMSGMGITIPTGVSTAIAQEAAKAAAEEAAKPTSTWESVAKTVSQVVDFGSQAAALYLQQKAIEEAKKREAELKAQATATMPKTVVQTLFPEEPIYKQPLFWVGSGILVLAGILFAAKSSGSNPRRRCR